MNKLLSALLVFILLPVLSYGHPGKTNRYGGHKCLKGCEEWGLFYDEYHLHDKDGKPIRVGKTKEVKTPGNAGLVNRETTTAAQDAVMTDATKTVVVTNYRYVTNVYEENLIQSNPLIYLLLTLLLLLLILLMNRKKKEN
jgi:hypothetical protein